jgi:hypothetical protein
MPPFLLRDRGATGAHSPNPDRRLAVGQFAGNMTKATVLTNSRDVAEMSGKQHQHVLRDIDRLVAQRPDFRLALVPHPTVSGRVDRSFDLTEHGFTLPRYGMDGPEGPGVQDPPSRRSAAGSCGGAPDGVSAPGSTGLAKTRSGRSCATVAPRMPAW